MKLVYLIDENHKYHYEAEFSYLVGPVEKEEAEPMTETNAKKIIECNPHLEIEDIPYSWFIVFEDGRSITRFQHDMFSLMIELNNDYESVDQIISITRQNQKGCE